MPDPDQMFPVEPDHDDDQSWWKALDDEAQQWEAAHAGSELVSIPNRSPALMPVDKSVDNPVDNL